MAVSLPLNSSSKWKDISLDPSSGVVLVHQKLHLGFPPYYLTDIRKSVKAVIDSRLIRYEPQLGGILAAYGRIAILKSTADTLFNLSEIHVDVEGDFYVFKPEIGRVLTGIVNKISADHIGCLIHNLFNVSLHKPTKSSIGAWPGRSAKLLDQVEFTIKRVDLQSQVPYIEGNIVKLIPTNLRENNSTPKQKASSDSGVSVASEISLTSDQNDKMERKRNKLSLSQRKNEALQSAVASSEMALNSTSSETDNQPQEPNKRKRKITSDSIIQETPKIKKSKPDNHSETESEDEDEKPSVVSSLVNNLFSVMSKKKTASPMLSPKQKRRDETSKLTQSPTIQLKKTEEMVRVPDELSKKLIKELASSKLHSSKRKPEENKANTVVTVSTPEKKKVKPEYEPPNGFHIGNADAPTAKSSSPKKKKSHTVDTKTDKEELNALKSPLSSNQPIKDVVSPKKSKQLLKTVSKIVKTETLNPDKVLNAATPIKKSKKKTNHAVEDDDEDPESIIQQLLEQSLPTSTPKSTPKSKRPSEKTKNNSNSTVSTDRERKPKASSPDKKIPFEITSAKATTEKHLKGSSQGKKQKISVENDTRVLSPERTISASKATKSSHEKIVGISSLQEKTEVDQVIKKTKSRSIRTLEKAKKTEVKSELEEEFDQEKEIRKIMQLVQPKEKLKKKSLELKRKSQLI